MPGAGDLAAGRAGQLEETEEEPKKPPGTALSERTNRLLALWRDRCANWGEHQDGEGAARKGQEGSPRRRAPADTAGHTLQGLQSTVS